MRPHRRPHHRPHAPVVGGPTAQRSIRWAAGAALWGLLAASSACRPDDQRTDSIDPDGAARIRQEMDSRLVAQLDSGGAAFRMEAYDDACRHYEAARALDDRLPAVWFGLFMCERARGDLEAAERALERARALAPGASLLQPDGER